MSRSALGLTQLPIQWVPKFFPGNNTAANKADRSLPSSAEVKNEYSYTPNTPLCFHGMDKDNYYTDMNYIIRLLGI
jgi:hypothetical protein